MATAKRRMIVLWICLFIPVMVSAQDREGSQLTMIYFVRHAEIDLAQPTIPLSAAGHQRAAVFAATVRDVVFTHVFSSHTTRARQMVEPVAMRSGLQVQQLPELGSRTADGIVSDRTTSRVAIAPLVSALKALPRGSVALVGVNSDNIYSILNGLGVPAATADKPCATGSTCVPCLSNTCLHGGYDQLWVLVLEERSPILTLIELHFGAAAGSQ